MILVIMLAMIVLVTIAVMAFFAHATANWQVESSLSNKVEAELIAQSALDYGITLIRQEITSSSNSIISTNDGPKCYLPKESQDIVPHRIPSTAIEITNREFYNLIRQSLSNSDTNASSHNTEESSRNGRMVNARRWNAPLLLNGTGFHTSDQLPRWIYVTRDGGITHQPTTNAIGRFAYNIYNIGGLLNINAAGFPSSLTLSQINQLKNTVAGADLTQLGVSASAIDSLIEFRNSERPSSGNSYVKSIQMLAADGFSSSRITNSITGDVYTNNHFVNRQDLLRYIRTKNPDLTNALPFLTHFSRSINSPSWVPINSTNAVKSRKDYEADAEKDTSENRNISNVRFVNDGQITHYRDDGTKETYDVKSGDPLLQRRFSLAKLEWLSPNGPRTSAFHHSLTPEEQIEAIQRCFGLVWNSSESYWAYVGPYGSNPASSIDKLAQVASDHREPTFFETLKAGILSGSIGSGGLDSALPVCATMIADDSAIQANVDLQLFKIGANIIDCGDSDNFPTILAMNPGAGVLEIAGTEDLPYLYALDLVALREVEISGTTYTMKRTHVVAVPEFISPHRPSPNSGTSGPDSVSFNVTSGTLTRSRCIIGGYWHDVKCSSSIPAMPSVSHGITISSSEFNDLRAKPQPHYSTNAANRLGSLVSYATGFLDAQVFLLFDYEIDDLNWAPFIFKKSSNASIYLQISNWSMNLSYRTPSGKTKIYATFGGREGFPKTTGLQGSTSVWNSSGPNFITTPNMGELGWSTLTTVTQIVPWDPRSQRFGVGTGYTRNVQDLPGSGANADLVRFCLPFTTSAGWNTKFPLAGWPQGSKSGPPNPIPKTPVLDANARDPDGILRPADGWLSASGQANPYRQAISSTSLDINHPSRPVLLQRPYQSVGELGYVFRDTPWKTLNFFDETSGDAALLDLFSVQDEPTVTAGRVDLNTPHIEVQQALLGKSSLDPEGSVLLPNPSMIAATFNNHAFESGLPRSSMPFNVSGLAAFLSTQETGLTSAGLGPIKYQREAIVRALSGSTQTRTWNIMIDVIAQSGRFPSSSVDAGEFTVEAEKRYWQSAAIDRYTAKLVERTTEPVNE